MDTKISSHVFHGSTTKFENQGCTKDDLEIETYHAT